MSNDKNEDQIDEEIKKEIVQRNPLIGIMSVKDDGKKENREVPD